ncbi:MAG: TonB-dependent receptor [Hyphomonadaceae bacterium]|nr:TonB-dependent receptor [Hyphomonadaceae bacterium]
MRDALSTLDPSYFNEGVYVNLPGTVEVRGFELSGTVDFNNGFTAIASYTDAKSNVEGGAQLVRVPRSYGKVGASYEAESGVWGADASVLWVGKIENTVAGFGRLAYGDYVVADFAAHVFIDADQKHKLTARGGKPVRRDVSHSARFRRWSDGTQTSRRFLVGTVGGPRTLHVSYSYAF